MDRDDTLSNIEYQTHFANYLLLSSMGNFSVYEFVAHGEFRFSNSLFGKSRFVGDKRD